MALTFILRLIKILVFLAVGAGLITLVVYALTLTSRYMWDAFEHLFYDQAKWARSKVAFLKPWKNCVTIFITALVVLAVVGFIAFVVMSGQVSQGDIIK